MQNTVTLDQVVELAKTLPTLDKIRLIEQVAPQIEQELKVERPTSRKSLLGLWRGLDITEADITQARQEMWKNFPRKDL